MRAFMVPCGSVRGLAVVHRARCATETLLIGIRRASSESTPQRIVHVMHAAPPRPCTQAVGRATWASCWLWQERF
jgi:hypothetical protein